jgi:hypothetical protein
MTRTGGAYGAYGLHTGSRRRAFIGLVMCALGIGVTAGVAADRLAFHASPTVTRPVTSGVPGSAPAGASHGVPVGYAHTPEGAAQAVGNYLAALGGRLALDPAAAQAALDQVADPSSRDRLAAGLAAGLRVGESLWGIQTAAQQGKRVVLTQTPIAYRVTSYTDHIATVAVWLVTNVGIDDHQRLAAFFANGGATVVWLNGDWRLRQIEDGSAAADTVPACLQTPTQTAGVPPQLEGFIPYGS